MSVLLAQRNEVRAVDIDAERIELLATGVSPIADPDVEDYLAHRELALTFTTDPSEAYAGADFVVIATPTDYDPDTNYFDTSTVEQVAKEVRAANPDAVMVLKSTVPVGFTQGLSERLGGGVIFSPEFLREGRALWDLLHPSRIVVGERSERAEWFAELLREAAV